MNDLSKAAGRPQATWLEVGEESAAQRIDNFLLRHLKGVPKSHVYQVLRSGQVRVNSGRVKPDYRLQAGDKVRLPPVRVAVRTSKARAAEFPIVFEERVSGVLFLRSHRVSRSRGSTKTRYRTCSPGASARATISR